MKLKLLVMPRCRTLGRAGGGSSTGGPLVGDTGPGTEAGR